MYLSPAIAQGSSGLSPCLGIYKGSGLSLAKQPAAPQCPLQQGPLGCCWLLGQVEPSPGSKALWDPPCVSYGDTPRVLGTGKLGTDPSQQHQARHALHCACIPMGRVKCERAREGISPEKGPFSHPCLYPHPAGL